jgi:hypothetical protein
MLRQPTAPPHHSRCFASAFIYRTATVGRLCPLPARRARQAQASRAPIFLSRSAANGQCRRFHSAAAAVRDHASVVDAGPMRAAVLTIAAPFAKLGQRSLALISHAAMLGGLRRSAGADQWAQHDERGQQQRRPRQSSDHDSLPLVATDISSRLTLEGPKPSSASFRRNACRRADEPLYGCIVSQSEVTSQYVSRM